MFSQFVQDARYGFRTFLLKPGFTAAALITLALGIGATTAMFSVVDAVLLRQLPYRDPDRLASFLADLSSQGYPRARVSPPEFLEFKTQRRLFEDVAAFNETGLNLSGSGRGAKQLNGILATYNLFSVLGVSPVLGRAFLPEEDRPGSNHVVLLSFGFWQREFAGNREVVGQNLRLNGETYRVIGVMPPRFSFPAKGLTEAGAQQLHSIDVWTPRAFNPQELAARQARYVTAVGRLHPGVCLESVNTALKVLAAQDARHYRNDMEGVSRFFVESLQETNTHEVKRGLWLQFCAVLFILLIACANVANLLLSRSMARRREIGVRMALGAHRNRILQQLITESGLLSLAGGILGIGLAAISFALLKQLIPADFSSATAVHFNWKVFAFAALICLGSSALFGLAPALQISKINLNETVREGGRGNTASRHSLGSAFVVGEIALSLLLLVGAGLLLKSLSNLQHVDPGFQTAHVLTLDFDWAEPRYGDSAVRVRFIDRVLEGVRALPGVEAAGFAGALPLISRGWTEDVTPENSAAWRDVPAKPIYRVVTPGYLEAMKIRLIRGRFFDHADRDNTTPVAIVNLKAAQDFWPNQNPIGKRLKLGRQNSGNPWLQVIGVTGNVKHSGLTEAPREEFYCDYLQARSSLQWQRFLAVRTNGDPLGIVRELRHIATDLDPDEPVNHITPLTDIVKAETHQNKIQGLLLGLFAALALLMATVGIYGVMAYMVTQRTHEIGVRRALGAQTSQIIAFVLKRGLRLALLGTLAGLIAAYFLTRLMRALLFDVSPTDKGIIAAVISLLIMTAICACLLPARRAASVDPMEALRQG